MFLRVSARRDETAGSEVRRGRDALRRLLRGAADLRSLEVEGFRRWLLPQVARWQEDPAFAQRDRLRTLRRAHPELRRLEQAVRRATAADEASPRFAELARLEQERMRAERAVEGLTQALAEAATPARRAALEEKHAAFRERLKVLARAHARAVQESPERQGRLRCEAALEEVRVLLGLTREEALLTELLTRQGRRSGGSGSAFEAQALALTRAHLVPELVPPGAHVAEVRVLTGVTLGAARTELDQLVVRVPARAGEPVEVLALVEVKRNADDVAHGFLQRQENLAWLTADAGAYAAAEYRTRHFRTGHFDRPAVHVEDGERFVFTRESFRRFRREPQGGPFLERLCFVTREGALHGTTAATLSRLRTRVASDERWAPESDAYLEGLLGWLKGQLLPLETPDVLRLYCADAERARQVLVVAR